MWSSVLSVLHSHVSGSAANIAASLRDPKWEVRSAAVAELRGLGRHASPYIVGIAEALGDEVMPVVRIWNSSLTLTYRRSLYRNLTRFEPQAEPWYADPRNLS